MMLTRWNTGWKEFDEMFATMNQLRRYVDSAFEGGLARSLDGGTWASSTWPRTNLIDAGNSLVLAAEVPGMTEKDIQLTLNQDVLSISGERRVVAPEGYSAHRQECRPVTFARSFALPCKVNPDKVTASVKNGILTVALEKAPDAMPRQIKVVAQ
jgi:HSP20 family protein